MNPMATKSISADNAGGNSRGGDRSGTILGCNVRVHTMGRDDTKGKAGGYTDAIGLRRHQG